MKSRREVQPVGVASVNDIEIKILKEKGEGIENTIRKIKKQLQNIRESVMQQVGLGYQ